MIQMGKVMAIARAETRVTRRLVRYWVFLSISFFIALIYYFYLSTLHGLYSSYSGTVGMICPRFLISISGLYYLIFYTAGVVFLSFDVRARDQRERMDEVLDSRPYTNLELVTGRLLGIFVPSWIPILALGILLELLGLILVAVGSPIGQPIEPVSLVFMIFKMALPALAFAISLTFLLTLLVRNRLVAAVLILILLGGSIYVSVGILPVNYATSIDFLGLFASDFPTDIASNMTELVAWMQRLAVLVAAFGILGLSAAVHPRLDGGSRAKYAAGGMGFLILASVLMGYGYHRRSGDVRIVETWNEFHRSYAEGPVPDIQAMTGRVMVNPGEALDLDLDLRFRAPEQSPLKNALFTLNPGLKVKDVLGAANQALNFTHKEGLLEIELPHELEKGGETTVHLSIKGLPDPRFSYLQSAFRPETEKALGRSGTSGTLPLLGYQSMIFDSKFVALMPGIRWLPTSGPEVNRYDPNKHTVDFFNVDLLVDLPDGWLVAGPGRRIKVENNTKGGQFRFSPSACVPSVALVASRFESRSMEIDGVLFEVLIHRKHLKNLEVMAETGEKIRSWIEDRLEVAKGYGLDYPYDALTLVEVPNLLRSYEGGWRMDTALAPPGMLLMREMGFPTARFDSAFRKPEDFKDREGGIAEAKWERLRSFFMNDFLGGNIISGSAKNFFNDQTSARGPEGLALNYVMEDLSSVLVTGTRGFFSAYILNRDINEITNTTLNSYFTVRSAGIGGTISDQLINNFTSRSEIWEKALGVSLRDMDPWDDPERMVGVITLKGNAISRSIMDILGQEKAGKLLSMIREEHRGKSYSLTDVKEACNVLGQDMSKYFDDWFSTTELPGFVCPEAKLYRLPDSDDGSPRYQLLFPVRNDEPTSGLFVLGYYFPGEDGGQGSYVQSKPLRLSGKSALRFGTVLSRPPSQVFLNPYLSLNRSIVRVPLRSMNLEKIEDKEAIEGHEEIPWALPKEDFIVVDDLDPGFMTIEEKNGEGFRLSGRADESEVTDQGLPVTNQYTVPPTWSRLSTVGSWGKYRHTLAAVRAGNGEKKAVFTAKVPHSGSWDLEIYIPPKYNAFPRRKWGTWNLVITDSNGDQHETKFDSDAASQAQWNIVGNFEIPEGEISVTLSNQTNGQFVVADAIRWLPVAGD
jgi:ABC-type transport system involved in multi-copper enzyme maturation permease subunit